MELVLLRDKWAAFCCFNLSEDQRVPRVAISDPDEVQGVVIIDGPCFTRLSHRLMLVLARTADEDARLVAIGCPDQAVAGLLLVLPWARRCLSECRRQFSIRSRMAVAQTMGGGWASVRHVENSLLWALVLRDLASSIGDMAAVRKCDVFVGWAHLWNGNRSASVEIFERHLTLSDDCGDAANWGRCIAALAHADGNPLFAADRGLVALPEVQHHWADAFAAVQHASDPTASTCGTATA